MKFEDYNISEDIKKNLSKLGFKKPTDIQFKSIIPILKGEDVLAIAQTGTGKTAAFAIPVINIIHEQKLQRHREDGIKCLIMVPTRELAVQIKEVFDAIGKHTKVLSYAVFGGVEQAPQIEKLQDGIDVLIATPGRMFDLVSQGYIHLSRVEILILDEADHMLDLGFIKDIKDVLRFLPKTHQTLFFSATIDKKIKELAYSLVKNAIRIQISPKNPVAKNINHSVVFIEPDDKRFFLERIVNEHPESKILVFVRTKVRAERVMMAMKRANIESQTIHGDKNQSDRLNALGNFKSGKVKILIATDVSARGIDIPEVEYVVNYDMPEQPENYVHRVGRTGRGKMKGTAISFCSNDEKELLQKIEEYTGNPINVVELDKETYQETLDFTADHSTNWKLLIKEAEKNLGNAKKGKKKKK